MSDVDDDFALRAYDDRGDAAFVTTTWVLSSADAQTRPWWERSHGDWLSALRASAAHACRTMTVVVLCSPTMPGAIMGWACATRGRIAHAYVRPVLRTTEVGRRWSARLLERARQEAT